MRLVVTGGAGFVGSHIVDDMLREGSDITSVVVVDKLTYAASIQNLGDLFNRELPLTLVPIDLCDLHSLRKIIQPNDLVVHVAAESHVDNSFAGSLVFTETNVKGTHTLLQVCHEARINKFLHVSTDEVYGENQGSYPFDESAALCPTNPYSASKAAAEMLVRAYVKLTSFPIFTIRSNNIVGIRQYPEKIIPRSVVRARLGMPIEIHGSGANRRAYLHVSDFCKAVRLVLGKGEHGGIYNVGSSSEFTNTELIAMIKSAMSQRLEVKVVHVNDRPFNDARYYIDYSLIRSMGWEQSVDISDCLSEIVRWYEDVDLSRWPYFSEFERIKGD